MVAVPAVVKSFASARASPTLYALVMKLRWIDNYAGTWTDDDGRTLSITPCGESTAAVTLLVNGQPMLRPWCGNKPTERLRGTYRSGSGPELDVELGRAGFSLKVNY